MAAIRYVTNGTYLNLLGEYANMQYSEAVQPMLARVQKMVGKLAECTEHIKSAQNQELLDLAARRLYEMAAVCVMSYLILQDATANADLFTESAQVYVNYAEAEIEKHNKFLNGIIVEQLAAYRK